MITDARFDLELHGEGVCDTVGFWEYSNWASSFRNRLDGRCRLLSQWRGNLLADPQELGQFTLSETQSLLNAPQAKRKRLLWSAGAVVSEEVMDPPHQVGQGLFWLNSQVATVFQGGRTALKLRNRC